MGNPYRHGHAPPVWDKPLRNFEVRDKYGDVHDIMCHYAFNNGAEGLIFRRYPHGSDRTEIVAAFAMGGWDFYKETTNVEG